MSKSDVNALCFLLFLWVPVLISMYFTDKQDSELMNRRKKHD